MTEKPTDHRKRSGQLNWLWMVMSIGVVAGFMTWLAASSNPNAVSVVEVLEDESAALLVTVDELAGGVDWYVGQTIRVGAEVASTLGPQAFWIMLPGNQPFLVKLGPELVAEGVDFAAGEYLMVTGRVAMMSDSVIATWMAQGVFENEGQVAQAEFALSYLDAVDAERSRRPTVVPGAVERQPFGGEAE